MTDRLTFAGTIAVDGRRLKGSVKIAGQRTPRNGELVEVDIDALHRADRAAAVMVVGHQAFGEDGYDPLRTVARVDNNTLRIIPTKQGFDYETDELPNTTYANDALELARMGVFGGASFDIFGLRSRVSVEPGNIRVRRFTSIAKFGAVTPVIDPAFPSSVAAFSKENPDMTDPIEQAEPIVAPPEPKAEPKVEPATFSEQPKSGKDEWAAFAKDISTEQIEATMDQVFAAAKGDPRGELLDRYEGFAAELQRRKREGAADKGRVERMEALHNLRLGRVPKAPEAGLHESDDYREAFGRYIRGDLTSMEQFAQSISGSGAEGGYTVPEEFRAKVTETLAAYGGIQQEAEVLETGDGRALPWPTNDDTSNSAVVASEGSAPASAGADLVFGEISLGAFSIAATGTGNAPLKVSWELLQDTAIDMESFVGRKLGERLGRKAAAYYATGVGTTEPFGLLAKTPATMTATTMYAALVEHHFQVNEAYRTGGNCTWVLSDTTLAKVYGSVDLNGRPLFIPAADASGAGRPAGILLGYPVRLDQGAGNLVAFGDVRAGYIIRRVRGIQVVVDPYNNTATRQTAYHAWMRTDANVQDSAAVSVSDYASVTADAVAA
jgi:HK97 family phage major capsid protein